MTAILVLLYFVIAFTFLIWFYHFTFYAEEGKTLAIDYVYEKYPAFSKETIEEFLQSNVCKTVVLKEYCKLCLLWPKLIADAIKRRKSRKK